MGIVEQQLAVVVVLQATEQLSRLTTVQFFPQSHHERKVRVLPQKTSTTVLVQTTDSILLPSLLRQIGYGLF